MKERRVLKAGKKTGVQVSIGGEVTIKREIKGRNKVERSGWVVSFRGYLKRASVNS